MREKIYGVIKTLLFVPFFISVCLWTMEGTAPPKIHVKAPTPETILEQLHQEALQRKYDIAEQVVDRVLRLHGCDTEWSEAVAHAAVNHGLNPRLMAGLVYVESTCRPNAVSGAKSVGLAQINPRVWRNYTHEQLLNPYTNAEIGATILAGYVHRYGVTEGLHHYNGMGNPTDEYSEKVLSAAGLA